LTEMHVFSFSIEVNDWVARWPTEIKASQNWERYKSIFVTKDVNSR